MTCSTDWKPKYRWGIEIWDFRFQNYDFRIEIWELGFAIYNLGFEIPKPKIRFRNEFGMTQRTSPSAGVLAQRHLPLCIKYNISQLQPNKNTSGNLQVAARHNNSGAL